jgi:hypothetical protein
MANVKISQLTAKNATLERTDRLAIADFNGSTYDSKYVTGAEVVQVAGVKYSASHTLNLDNSYYMVEIDSSSAETVTIPANATTAIPIRTVIYVCQLGTGQVTISGAAGVTLRSSNAEYKTNGQYSVIVLRKRLTNEWVMWGDKTT